MSISKFISGILICIALSYVLFFILRTVMPIAPYLDFMHYSVGFFLIFTLVIYGLGHYATNNETKNMFLSIVMGNVLIKLLAAFLVVYLYSQATQPQDTYFVFPFLWVYLIFLIFETYFLSKQAKTSK